jgi:plasmid stabilization system protein ParE
VTRYTLSPDARHDVLDAWDYIAEESVDRADAFRDELFAAFDRLADYPGIGHRYPGVADPSLLVWSVGSYLIFYRPDTRPLQIARIFHGQRDVPRLLG